MRNPYLAPGADLERPASAIATYRPRLWSLNGRIGRLRFLAYLCWPHLAGMAGLIAVGVCDLVLHLPALATAAMVASYLAVIPMCAIIVRRRLHDTNGSGWWCLLLFVPLAGLLFALWLALAPGEQEANRFGAPPCANSRAVYAGALCLALLVVLSVVLVRVGIPALVHYQSERAWAGWQGSPLPPSP